jgi:hypothetical protein
MHIPTVGRAPGDAADADQEDADLKAAMAAVSLELLLSILI